MTIGIDGMIKSINQASKTILGYEPEGLVGRSFMDLVHSEDQDLWVEPTFAANEVQTERFENRCKRKDGNISWIEWNTQYFSEEGVVYCVARDITERKEAEEERARLRGREQAAHAEAEAARTRLAAILDNLSEGVLVASQEGRMLFANPAARAMMDTISSEMPEDLPNPWEDFNLPNAVTRCAQNRENIEARVQYGETFLRVRLECPADLDNRGDVLVVIQDLSEGHRLEANQQRFLANAAHQLRTPTMAILGAAELLVTGDYEDPTVRRSLLNHIFAEGNRMKRLSEVLLHLSRIGWDSRNPNPQSVSLRKAGHHAAERIAPLAENMGLNILIEGDDHHVCADPEWLEDVLLALLNNAIKHSHQGSEIKLCIHNGAIIVEDEGDGISSDDLPYIFERFYRGDEGPEGFGLGLLICRELTERMGGMISVTSHEEVGTAVKIELPEAHIIDD
jgi:PAS domain S-box-containing protein